MNKLIKILHEPLLHFLIIGGALFMIFEFSASTQNHTSQKIEVNLAIQKNLKQQFQRTWKRPPNEIEEKKLIEHFIREEVFYREAIELGLDKNDTVIRQRLRQKLEFFSQSENAALNDDLLQRYFIKNSTNYFIDEKRAFKQFFIGENRSEQYISDIADKLKTGNPETMTPELAGKSILPAILPLSNEGEIAQVFGKDFSKKIMQLNNEQWYGPIDSHLGSHFVALTDIQKGYLPELSSVSKRVENDWRYNLEFEDKELQFQRYLTNYDVVITTNEEE